MRTSVALILALVLVSSACQSSTPPSQSGAPSAAGVRGGRVVGAVGEQPASLSPVLGDDFISQSIWLNFYRPMLNTDPNTGQLVGELAKSFSLSSDLKTITFQLRDGLTWSDGQPITGEDYRYTAEAVSRSKKSAFNQNFVDVVGFDDYVAGKADSIKGIAVAGNTITVTRANATCVGMREVGLVDSAIIPQHSFVRDWNNKTLDATKNIDDSKLNDAPPASSGPFVFTAYHSGVDVTMTRNEKYFRGAPLLDEYIVKIYSGPQALKAALLTGEVTFATYVPANDVEEIQKTGKDLNYIRVSTPTDNNFIGWNQKSPTAPWLAVKEVRQALWYGLDVKTALQKIMLGYATQTYTHTAPSFWSYPANGAGLNHYDYNPAKAKQLLEQAGAKMGSDGVYRWTNGQPMSMKIDGVGGGAPPGLVIEIAQEQYKQIGIQIVPNLLSFPAFVDHNMGKAPDRDGTFWGWTPGGPEAEPVYPFYDSKGSQNLWNYSNPAADKAIEAGRDGPDCSQAARQKAYTTFNQILNDDAANTYLWMRDFIAFSSKSLLGFDPKPFSLYSDWNAEKWSIKK
ncbi:MAG: ABC transporter substrate-binding protein [Chloroflexota bacterium]|nr:ABC transporter substrate-binding protein [Chloroflexota bacterium]